MDNQLNSRSCNIRIVQNISYIVPSIKVRPVCQVCGNAQMKVLFVCVCASSEVGFLKFDSIAFCWNGFCCRPAEHQGKINKRKPMHTKDASSEWFCCRPVDRQSKMKKWYPCVSTDTSPDSVLFQSLPGRPPEAVSQQPGQRHPPLQL